MADLVKWCEDELRGYRESGYRIYFNLTGGFKSVQGFLQTLAMFYADESLYIFETGSELLRIPRLPINIDTDEIKGYSDKLRRLEIFGSLPISELEGVAETLLLVIDGEASFSAWGAVLWNNLKRELYRSGLLPSPISQIVYDKKFEKSCQNLQPDRYLEINKRIDELAEYIASGGEKNPRSLNLKVLHNPPKKEATHQINAWSDKDAKRIFCRRDGDTFTLLELDEGLH